MVLAPAKLVSIVSTNDDKMDWDQGLYNADNTQTRFKNGQCSNKGQNVATSWAEILDTLEGEVQVDGNQQPNNALNSDSVASVNNIAINQQLLDDCTRDSNSEEDWFDQPVTVP